MLRRLSKPVLFFLLTICCCEACSAGLQLEVGNFTVRIQRQQPFLLQQNIVYLGTSPWSNTHTRNIGSSFASAAYSTSWSNDEGDFAMGMQSLHDFEGHARSSGGFNIIPSVESIVEIHGTMQYDHPPSTLATSTLLSTIKIDNVPGYTFLDDDAGGSGSLTNPSASGVLSIGGAAILQPGIRYEFNYSFRSFASDPPPAGGALSAHGSLELSVRPIPEPATALLALVPAAFLVARKHPRTPSFPAARF